MFLHRVKFLCTTVFCVALAYEALPQTEEDPQPLADTLQRLDAQAEATMATPPEPVPVHGSRCGPGVVSLTGVRETSATTFNFYATATATNYLYQGRDYVTPYLTATTTYYIATVDIGTGAVSGRVPIMANIYTPPPAPTIASEVSAFPGGSVNIFVHPVSGVSGYRWYTVPSGGTPLSGANANITTVTVGTTPTTYYVATVTGGMCESATRKAVVANVEPAPVPTVTNNGVVAMAAPVTLDAGAGYATYDWKNSTGTTISTARSFETTTPDDYTVTVTKTGVSGNGTSAAVKVAPQETFLKGKNYILTNTAHVPTATENDLDLRTADGREQAIQYMDDLGRPMQTIAIQRSPNKKDIITPVVYDAYGRESVKYLPYASRTEGNGLIKNALSGPAGYPSSAHYTFYNTPGDKIADDTQPFAATTFDRSPLGLVLEQGAPGFDWRPQGIVSVFASGLPGSVESSYPDYDQYYDYSEFVIDPNGGGGGVRIKITNNVLTVTFNAGFTSAFLKTGRVKLIDIPSLYDIDLGIIGEGKYYAYIQDRYLSVESLTIPAQRATQFALPGPNASVVFTRNLLAPETGTGGPATGVSRATQYSYDANAADEVLKLTPVAATAGSFALISTGGGSTPAYYAEATLSKKVIRDADKNVIIEYHDMQGNLILKRIQAVAGNVPINDTNYAGTYYIYDDFNRLVCVIPPEAARLLPTLYYNSGATDATKEAFLKRWAFRYAYDTRHRLAMKQVPGSEPVYMVYDSRDRLVLTQDGNQRTDAAGNVTKKEWSFTKYDVINRPVMTGVYTHGTVVNQAAMQNHVNSLMVSGTQLYEEYNGAVATEGYTNRVFPTSATNLLTVTYYDQYDFRSMWTGNYNYVNDGLSATPASGHTYYQPAAESTHVAGLVTGKKVKLLTGNTSTLWLKTVTFYDDEHRPVQVLFDQYKRGPGRTSNVYDFAGRVLKSNVTHMDNVVTWKDLVNVVENDLTLVKTTPEASWNGGAVSVEQIPANTDGWLEFTASETTKVRMIGLSDQNTNSSYNSIDFAIYLVGTGDLRIYENGTEKASFPNAYNVGDIFRVERTGGVVRYYRNGVLLYTSLIGSTTLLMADVSIGHLQGTVVGARISASTRSRSVTRTFKYDHAGRLTHTWHQADKGANILLSKLDYNELGQVVDRMLHSTVASAADNRQSVDYRYDIQGKITSINNADLTNDGVLNDDATDYFGMHLLYNTVDAGLGNAQYYNGNISAMRWSNYGAGTVKQKASTYMYDRMSRLSASAYHEKTTSWGTLGNNRFAETGLSYDLNGNILKLTRNDNRATGTMDVLTYDYGAGTSQSNRLLSVTDDGDDLAGFIEDVAADVNDYTYDANGNMTRDLNKGIGSSLTDATNRITYNILNLPEVVTKAGNTIRYLYDADGTKHAQTVTFGSQVRQTEYAGEFVYENDALQFINHEEGRVVTAATTLVYRADAGLAADFTAVNAAVTTTQSGTRTYVKVTANGPVARTGVFPVGGDFVVAAGERYKVRVKGYRTGASAANLLIKAGGADLSWPGAALPAGVSAESWVEQIVVIPNGATTLQAGVVWGTVTSGEVMYLSDVEITRLASAVNEYQYHLKDHLGNVRLTFTTAVTNHAFAAGFESADQSNEASAFNNYPAGGAINTQPENATTGTHSHLLNGGYSGQIGLAKSFSVMPGDVVSIRATARYAAPTGMPTNYNGFVASLLGAFHLPAPVAGEAGTASAGMNAFANWEMGSAGNAGGPDPMKLFVNIVVFDKDYNLLDVAYTASAESGAEITASYTIGEPGYAYVYYSNEHPYQVNAYFDDIAITHTPSAVIQVDDYYPFGMTFNSSRREELSLNRYLYNQGLLGKKFLTERVYDLGLDIDLTKYRAYDPALGRWWQIDPLASEIDLINLTPYNYAFNNPVRYNDPEGDCPCIPIFIAIAEGVVAVAEGATLTVGAATVGAAIGTAVKLYGTDILEAIGNGGPGGTPAVSFAMSSSQRGELSSGNFLNAKTKRDGPPNPDGAKGKPDHQEKVKELEKKAQSEAKEGETVVTEKKIANENSNRKPDVQIIDPNGKTRKVFEAERRPGSKRNRMREEEYRQLGIDQETHKVGGAPNNIVPF
ncbi:DUF6443 domain-containing protein [Dawidia soli]|uniref:RHS repeat-associated core domain-containing protein n=1 Tax=Dawidia soli TaxID=2782352 RepID=A0AAP2DA62_9BACT|nr:DUF6443 domain-containing protein [Dawidia soli]MBT1688276.1 hypothetical protein [Dawidia soli]